MKPRKHILVVEDTVAAREAMRSLLETEGYRVACAANGREALEYLTWASPPDLILLDLSMPVMDGWTFRQYQRRNPAWASIPVVVVSAENDLAWHAASLAVAGCLPKPVEFDGLLEAVRVTDEDRSPESLPLLVG